jgi:hypothetical protein
MTYLAKARSIRTTPSAPAAPLIDAHAGGQEELDDLIGALSIAPVVPTQPAQPMTWPPPEPPWFAAWMTQDDARRIATLAAAMQRKADSKRHPRGNP